MKYLIRFIALTFIFPLMVYSFLIETLRRCGRFLKHGGEFVTYKDDRITLSEMYNQLNNPK